MAYEPVHPVNLEDSEGYDPGVAKNLSAGMTESSRFIMKKQLDRNYKLTKIKFDLRSGKFITSLLPAVIRVYQKDFETDAKYLIISGNAYVQANYEEDIDLNITDREATREVVVDSWAPPTWSGWTANGGSYGTASLNPATTNIGSHINAQPFIGHLQLIGRPIHQIPDNG